MLEYGIIFKMSEARFAGQLNVISIIVNVIFRYGNLYYERKLDDRIT